MAFVRIVFISAQPGIPQSLPFYASGAGCGTNPAMLERIEGPKVALR
jgi:hypothetical protein